MWNCYFKYFSDKNVPFYQIRTEIIWIYYEEAKIEVKFHKTIKFYTKRKLFHMTDLMLHSII